MARGRTLRHPDAGLVRTLALQIHGFLASTAKLQTRAQTTGVFQHAAECGGKRVGPRSPWLGNSPARLAPPLAKARDVGPKARVLIRVQTGTIPPFPMPKPEARAGANLSVTAIPPGIRALPAAHAEACKNDQVRRNSVDRLPATNLTRQTIIPDGLGMHSTAPDPGQPPPEDTQSCAGAGRGVGITSGANPAQPWREVTRRG